ncbi:MAG: hypothetical protein A2V88_05625 [Elusimicrobia bacterium RBG_16_66_12]|nr:MAG: hypothetical protein A2V88_05625 [Elusimicrobia bacterium RBG_16_66_12]
MTRNTLMIIAGLAFAPLSASAQVRAANSILRGQIQALSAAGFSGMAEVQMPQAPATARTLSVSAQVDETAEALASLSRAAQTNVVLIGATVRTLGFDFDDGPFPARGIERQPSAGGLRFFAVTTFRGNPEIIIEEFDKARQELRSYLITSNGNLVAAAMTRKISGKFQAEKIPTSEAQTGCRNLLEFWTRYYRDNLKNA